MIGSMKLACLRNNRSDLLLAILRQFMSGEGTIITGYIFSDAQGHTKEEAQADFNTKISKQIWRLTGTQPKIVSQQNGSYR